MIKEINENNINEITILQKNFSSVFSNHTVLSDLKNNPYTRYLIYILENNIVGFINYYLIYDRIEIVNFNVLKRFQNKHIGSNLLSCILNIAEKNKINSITLEVKIDNLVAIHLYHKYGFLDKTIRKKYYNGVDAILMEKELVKK